MGLLTEYGSQEFDGGVGVREGSDGLRRGLLSLDLVSRKQEEVGG